MIKINYNFKALSPIHTGSDQNLGTLRQLRREAVNVTAPRKVKTRFAIDQKRLKRQAIALLILRLWDKMPSKNRMTIYEEIASKLLASTSVRSKEEFLQKICEKLEIREITTSKDRRFDVVDILELFDDYELLELIRKESQYIITFFRKLKDDNIFWLKENGKSKVARNTIFEGEDISPKSPEVVIMDSLEQVIGQPFREEELSSSIEHIPFISGNSIRGLLRRVAMYDFVRLVGIKKIEPRQYHQLFTGGTLSEANGFEDIGFRNDLVLTCPMVGLFGAAAGRQTISGELRVGKGTLVCSEMETGRSSFHDLINIDFGTRLDSSKTESEVQIDGDDKDTHQMIYQQEVFVTGSVFDHSFSCTSENPLIISAFYRLLSLFVQDPVITAKGNIGYGEIDLSELECKIPNGGDKLYLDYLSENIEKCRAKWESELTVPV